MRFLELYLKAYGPFTDLALDLSRGSQGLHVVYGPNEAGKSTTLRAIKALLHGFPHFTSDNHLHGATDLRVGARLLGAEGQELAFLRRKGRKNTLFNLDGEPLDEDILAGFIGGVTSEVLSNAFALSHEDLVRGGRDLVDGKGDVGESLFAAGLGSGGLRQLLRDLEAESDLLFRPRGQKHQAINAALSQLKEQKKLVTQLSLPGRTWSEHRKAYEAAGEELREVMVQLNQRAAERERLRRLMTALPRLAERQRLLDELEALGELPPIDHERFAERRRTAVVNRNQALEAERHAQKLAEELNRQILELRVPEAILENEQSIADLYKRLGEHTKATTDRTRLQNEQDNFRTQAHGLIRELWPNLNLEEAQKRIVPVDVRTLVRQLSRQHQGHFVKVESTTQAIEESTQELEDALALLAAIPPTEDLANLQVAFEAARRGAELEEELRRLEQELLVGGQQASLDLRRLGLWQGSLDELESSILPDEVTIDRLELERQSLDNGMEAIRNDESSLKDEHESIKAKVAAMELAGEVPTEQELKKARDRRLQGWKLVRRAWLEAADVTAEIRELAGEEPLALVYEQTVDRADHIADRLRREANRTAEHSQFRARQMQVLEKMADLAERECELVERSQQWERQWSKLWDAAGIVPHSTPREMRSWLSRSTKLLDRARQLRELRAKADQLGREIEGMRHQANKPRLISDADAPLSVVQGRTREVIEEQKQKEKQRVELTSQIQQLERTRDKNTKRWQQRSKAMQSWTEQWVAAVRPVGLTTENPTPEMVEAVLDRLDLLEKCLDNIASRDKRIKGIDRDSDKFVEDLRRIVDHAASDLDGQPAEQAGNQLHARLQRALRDAATLDQLKKRLDEQQRAAGEAAKTTGEMDRHLADLCHEAGVEDMEELPAVEDKARHAAELRRQLAAQERTLTSDGGGATLDELIEQARVEDSDALPARLEAIQHEIDELEARRSKLNQTIGGERTTLETMDGSDGAAEAAEVVESTLARLRDDAERFVRLRLAYAVLRREIERYRQENQGPLLQRASEIFRQITLDSFQGLETHYHERTDEPVLRAVRTDSEQRLEVSALSDGTQDQLYLALRLASVERYAQTNDPTPLIFDDILILFDDQRSQATLEVLADISRSTQVLFFTHHRRLVELAQELGNQEHIFLTELPERSR